MISGGAIVCVRRGLQVLLGRMQAPLGHMQLVLRGILLVLLVRRSNGGLLRHLVLLRQLLCVLSVL